MSYIKIFSSKNLPCRPSTALAWVTIEPGTLDRGILLGGNWIKVSQCHTNASANACR